jgi:hypothetical protein
MEGAHPQGVAQRQPGRSRAHSRRKATERPTDRHRRREGSPPRWPASWVKMEGGIHACPGRGQPWGGRAASGREGSWGSQQSHDCPGWGQPRGGRAASGEGRSWGSQRSHDCPGWGQPRGGRAASGEDGGAGEASGGWTPTPEGATPEEEEPSSLPRAPCAEEEGEGHEAWSGGGHPLREWPRASRGAARLTGAERRHSGWRNAADGGRRARPARGQQRPVGMDGRRGGPMGG